MPGPIQLYGVSAVPGMRRNAVYPVEARLGALPPGPLTAIRPWRFLAPTLAKPVRDASSQASLVAELVDLQPLQLRTAVLGTVPGPCRHFHLKAYVYDAAGMVVPYPMASTVLTPVVFRIRSESGPIFKFTGQPALGILFNGDLYGGELLELVADTTDPRTAINGLSGHTVQVEMFLNIEPRFQIEVDRKGNPDT